MTPEQQLELQQKVAEAQFAGLSESRVVEILNAPDPALGLVPMVFNCRAVAKPAALSGELGMLKVVAKVNVIPADISPTEQPIPVSSAGMAVIETLLDAIDRDLQVDPSQPGEMVQVVALLDGIEALGLLSATTKAAILAGTVRQQSWAEANDFPNGITARDVGLARGDE